MLWRKSPLLLLRFPQILVALTATIVVMTIAAVSGPLFLRATQTQSISEGVAQASSWLGGFTAYYPTEFFKRRGNRGPEELVHFGDRMATAFEDRFRDLPEVGSASTTYFGTGEVATGVAGRKANVLLLHRSDAIQNITVLSEAEVEGVWIADGTAKKLGIRAGDEITLTSGERRSAVPVQGIYRSLAAEEEREFWAPLSRFIYRSPGSFFGPLPFVLADRTMYEGLLSELRTYGGLRFDFELEDTQLTPERATAAADTFAQTATELEDPSSALSEVEGPFVEEGTGGSIQADTALKGIVDTATTRVTTVSPVVDLLSAAARIVALATVAAAGFYMVQRRRVEAVSLIGRGVGPLPQALRYTVQALLPTLLGVGLGVSLGYALVAQAGPSERLGWDSLALVWRNVAVTTAAAVAILYIASAAAVRRAEQDLRGGTATLIPARVREYLPLCLALALGAVILTQRDGIRGDTAEALADPRLTLVPIALVLCGGIVGAELLRFGVAAVASRLKYRSPGLYLAAKRLTGATTMPRVLVVAAACSLGVAVYGFTISTTIEATADAKARVFVGSDYGAFVGSNSETPKIDLPITQVAKIDGIELSSGGTVTLMGINPETFEAAAYWNKMFSEDSLGDMLARLEMETLPTPVIVAGAEASGTIRLGDSSSGVDLKVVGDATAFPGMGGTDVMVILEREALRQTLVDLGSSASTPKEQIWVNGDPEEAESALKAVGLSPEIQLSADRVLQTPTLTALLYVLGALGALGVAAAIVAVVTLLLFLQARHKGAMTTTALVRRMGLSRNSELISWTAELLGALGVAFGVATLVGLPISALMAEQLDPKASIPPPPVLATPVGMMAFLGVSVVAVAVVGGLLLRRSADKADVASLFRT